MSPQLKSFFFFIVTSIVYDFYYHTPAACYQVHSGLRLASAAVLSQVALVLEALSTGLAESAWPVVHFGLLATRTAFKRMKLKLF
jgi:hypothetical protein